MVTHPEEQVEEEHHVFDTAQASARHPQLLQLYQEDKGQVQVKNQKLPSTCPTLPRWLRAHSHRALYALLGTRLSLNLRAARAVESAHGQAVSAASSLGELQLGAVQ